MKKKIIFLVLKKGFGGIENQVTTLANSLVDLYDVSLLFLDDIKANLEINPKIKIIIKEKKILPNNNKYYSNLLKNMDVVIGTDNYFNKYIVKYAKGKKILWELRSSIENDIENKYYSLLDSIVVLNQDMANYYKKYNNNNNVVIINKGITIKDKESALNNKDILFIGKLEEKKNVSELLNVFSNVKKKVDAKLLIVGEGKMRSSLEELVKAKKMRDVYFLGYMGKDEIGEVCLNSSLYVTCSLDNTFGSAILEAMSYGIPAIAYADVKNYSQFIIDDINGYLIENHDVDLLEEKIITLLKDDTMRHNFGNCAREKVLEFDINSVKREWIKLL